MTFLKRDWITYADYDFIISNGSYDFIFCSMNVLHELSWFGEDRVNFHQNPGRGTAGWADPTPTWPNRAGCSIPCAVMVGSGGGKLGGGNSHGSGARGRGRGGRLCGSCDLCCVFPLSVLLLFLFPLFAVLLNCPYPTHHFSACFFPFSSAPQREEGRPSSAFVASHSQTITLNLAPNVGGG